MSAPQQAHSSQPCIFFAKGRCKYGDQCQRSHVSASRNAPKSNTSKTPSRNARRQPRTEVPPIITPSQMSNVEPLLVTTPQTPTTSTSPLPTKQTKRGELPCFKWQRGACPKGDKCWYGHDPKIQEAELQRLEELARKQEAQILLKVRRNQEGEQRRHQEEERRRALESDKARRAEETRKRKEEERRLREDETRRREEAERIRQQETSRQEARFVLQQIVHGSVITFTAGLEVRDVLTGFELCRITVQNLPGDTRQQEIEELFAQQGLDIGRFHLSGQKVMPNGKREAEIITDAELGAIIAAGLNDIEFRNERLVLSVGVYNGVGGMGTSNSRDTDVLVMSFHAPSIRYVAEVPEHLIQDKIRQLNGRICAGRQVKVERNTMPPGRVLHHFRPNSIKILGLPLHVDDETVAIFADSISVKRLKSGLYTDLDIALQQLRRHVDHIRQTTAFDVSNRGEDAKGIVSVRAHFESHEVAKEVYNSLEGNRLSFLGNSSPWLRLNDPLSYTITVPRGQYQAQRVQWEELRDSIKDKKACNLKIFENDAFVRIQLVGSVRAATGALKVQVENLVVGEKVAGWHQHLAYPSAAFMQRIEATGAFLISTPRRQSLMLYGKSREVAAARELVIAELERLASSDYTLHLPRPSVGYFVRQGLATFREMYGEESAQLDVTNGTITIRGPEEARHQLHRLINESKSAVRAQTQRGGADETCPICTDTATSPYKLGCGHVYCTACLRHLLITAVDTRQFPIKCDGDESRCGTRIAIPIVQRFLPRPDFAKLVEAVFDWYISQNPHEFKSCKTPACTQIYRTTKTESIVQCPSCFAQLCSRCGEDGHQGMTCDEHRLANDSAEQEGLSERWLSEQAGIKKCPRCSRLLEKSAGCNHMTCPCGAHICWRCMGIFSSDEIYGHMNAAHGGFYGDEPARTPQPTNRPPQPTNRPPQPTNRPPQPVNPAPRVPDPFLGANYLEQERLLREAANRQRLGGAYTIPAYNYNAPRFFNPYAVEQERERAAQAQRRLREEAERRREDIARRARGRTEGRWCTIM